MANLKDIGYGVGKYLTLSDASDIPDIGTNRKNIDLLNFKLATNNAYALYNFKDGMIDAYQTEAGVDTATSTNETYDSTTKTYGPTIVAAATTAFTSTGASTWTCPAGITSAEILVVAGGGGGSGMDGSNPTQSGGGGGGGGVVHHPSYTVVPAVVYDVSVGAGGAGGTGSGSRIGTAGTDSVFNINAEGSGATMTALGGGAGGPSGNEPGLPGGSGGGGGRDSTTAGTSTQGDSGGGTGYGNAGGVGGSGGGGPQYATSGGGGGAGSAGVASPSNTAGGAGGAGREFSSFSAYGTDSSNSTGGGYFAGGGGGGGKNTRGEGVSGGGGPGGQQQGNSGQETGAANTGGGGGGSVNNQPTNNAHVNGAAGGSGIVLIKTAALTTNMTLESNTQAAQADPIEGRLMLYEEDVDTITLDKDLKGYVSRNGGTNWAQTPLALDSNITHPASLLLHCDGSNGGTTFTDSSYWQLPVIVGGATHTDTAVKKFGTASAQFDGTTGNDYLEFATASGFGLGTGDWTIDWWVRSPNWSAGAGYGYHFDMRGGVNSLGSPYVFTDTGNNNRLGFGPGTGGTKCSSNVDMVNDVWYHIAVVKYNNVTKMYTDGVTGASGTYPTEYADTTDYKTTNPLRIGDTSHDGDAYALNGYIDEFRVTKGIARWTANFTPDTSPYTGTEGDTRILSGSVDISGQPAGSNMKYKIETLNNKNLKLHGASLLWA